MLPGNVMLELEDEGNADDKFRKTIKKGIIHRLLWVLDSFRAWPHSSEDEWKFKLWFEWLSDASKVLYKLHPVAFILQSLLGIAN